MKYLISKIGFPANYSQYGELLFASTPWWRRPLFQAAGRYRYYHWCWSKVRVDETHCIPLIQVVYDTQKREGAVILTSSELYAYLVSASPVPAENLLSAYLSRRMDEVPGLSPVKGLLGLRHEDARRRFPIE